MAAFKAYRSRSASLPHSGLRLAAGHASEVEGEAVVGNQAAVGAGVYDVVAELNGRGGADLQPGVGGRRGEDAGRAGQGLAGQQVDDRGAHEAVARVGEGRKHYAVELEQEIFDS